MMNEVFTAELLVADRRDFHQREAELAQRAEEWFGGPVAAVSLEVSMRRIDDTLRYVVTGRFYTATADVPRSRLESAAKWLGLT